ncbi:ArnT family glycosyltransferase [Mucisphaera calidilacus]|uniref:Undecaprenyl phosphate-alpha-4-amino-4-deoxy-L-arabinose arabinosyl transferase n=1 Tax=Mucisphaera calidilacus TaxID=2527982 RepID=A0A518BY94_9BACT|nr:hypothetical protein [Mucisphaera calidilacus]QDU71924.1 Undecaprenyl phosphate-alpha-4-amino-4-deoxy-L-arabinose arabinosyl transferase [Mucisphaera calidilacus]
MKRSGPGLGVWLTAVFAAVVLSHLLLLASPPLARTEVHRALVAMDALDHGHWVVTSILGETYLRKPPFHPWVLAACSWLFDTREAWVFRLPTILAAGGSAVWLAWLGSRWFGGRAGVLSGFAFLWLFALWAQNRTAEIDGLNTLLALLVWGGLTELVMGRARRPWRWSLLIAWSLGAALLTKGPACLTVVLPALIAPTLAGFGVRWLLRPAVWLPIVAGVLLAAGWFVAVDRLTAGAGASVEQAGVNELVGRFTSRLTADYLLDVVSMPLLLIAYSLPVSLASLAAVYPSVRAGFVRSTRRRLVACVWGFGLGCLLSVVFLLENPRYGYILLPLLTLPAGVMLDRWLDRRLPEWLMVHVGRIAVVAGAGALAGLAAMVVSVWPVTATGAMLLVCVLVPLLLLVVVRGRALAPAGWLLVGTVALGATSMGYSGLKHADRYRFSSATAAGLIAEHVDRGEAVVAGKLWNDKPGLFYYAGVVPRRLLDEALEGDAPGVTGWYVLYPFEVEQMEAAYPGRVEVVEEIEGERLNARLVRLTRR